MSLGKMTISEEVFFEIARNAMHSVEYVVVDDKVREGFGGAVKSALQRFMSDITIKTNDKNKKDTENDELFVPTVAFDIKLAVLYGARIPTVVSNVRSKIMEEVEMLTGYRVERIDVTVDRLIRPEHLHKDEEPGSAKKLSPKKDKPEQ